VAEQYKVLLIVPELGLNLAPEQDAFYPLGFYVHPIQGEVTRERIFANVSKREFDIIHYAGDAGPAGVRLSNDHNGGMVILEASALVQIARAVKAKLVFLNGCSSIIVGQTLIDEHIPYCICTLAEIDNIMARETSQMFYQALAETHDIRTAFDLSKPPRPGAYVCLSNGVKEISLKPILDKLAVISTFMTRNDTEHQAILQTIADNESEHDRIMRVLLKSRAWNIVIMLAGMVGVGLIVGLMGLLGRGALP